LRRAARARPLMRSKSARTNSFCCRLHRDADPGDDAGIAARQWRRAVGDVAGKERSDDRSSRPPCAVSSGVQRCDMKRIRQCLGLGLLLGAGLAGAARGQGAARFDGQYVGQLTLTAIISGDCTTPPVGALYPLSISEGVVRFKYVPRFDTTLIGTVDDKGNLKASRRLRSGSVTMTGRIDGNSLSASIVSPSCKYSFQTKN
jgi:hypothetical protein